MTPLLLGSIDRNLLVGDNTYPVQTELALIALHPNSLLDFLVNRVCDGDPLFDEMRLFKD